METSHRAKIITFNGYGPENYEHTGTSGPDDPNFGKRILCEGDSWFSLGAIPSSNLLEPLRFQQATLLVNLAKPGDTLKNISQISRNPRLKELIHDRNFATKWDAIFISAGGNDLIDSAKNIICTPSKGAGKNMLDYINRIEIAKLSLAIRKGYLEIARLRESSKNADTPIVTHVYDYPTPRNSKAEFIGMDLVGPWLYLPLKAYDVPKEYWISIVDYLYESLVSAILDASTLIDNFHVITSTKEKLIRADLDTTEKSGDWLNEIHPTAAGYSKLAAVISDEFVNIFA